MHSPFLFNISTLYTYIYKYINNYFIYFKRGFILGTELSSSRVALNVSIASVGVIIEESNEK